MKKDYTFLVPGFKIIGLIFLFFLSIIFCLPIKASIVSPNAVTTAQAGNDSTICNSTIQLYGNSPGAGESGTWSIPAGLTINDIHLRNATLSGLQEGNSYELVWTINQGGNFSRDTVIISYTATSTANAGADFCAVSSLSSGYAIANLSGSSLLVNETASWSVITSSSATIDSILSPGNESTQITGLEPGLHQLRYSIVNNLSGCSTSDDIDINVISNASITTVKNCYPLETGISDTTIVLSGVAASAGETILWESTNPFSTASIETPGSNNTNINNLERGTHTFKFKKTNASCADSSTITITLTSSPGNIADTCVLHGTSLNLSEVPHEIFETVQWQSISGNFENAMSPSTTYAGFDKGSNTISLTFSDSSATCSFADSFKVTSVTQPLAGNDTCIILNEGQTQTNYILNNFSYEPLYESLSCYSINEDTLIGYGQNINISLTNGIHRFVSIITNISSGCEQRDTVEVTVINEAVAGPYQCLIEPVALIALNAQNLPASDSPQTGYWESDISLDFDDLNNPNTTINNPPSGVLELNWVTQTGFCVDTSTAIISIISRAQTMNDTCSIEPGSAVSIPLTAQGFNNAYQSGQWTLLEGNGIIQNSSSNNTSLSQLQNGSNKFIWEISDTISFCSSRDTIEIISVTSANAGSDQCISSENSSELISLSANPPSSEENGYWVNADSTWYAYSTVPNLNINLPIGRHVFIWKIENSTGLCFSEDTCIVTIIEKPNAGENLCLTEPQTSIQLNAELPSQGGQNHYWTNYQGLTLDNVLNENASIASPPSGTFTFYWNIENKGCKDSSEVKVSLITKAKTGNDLCIRLDSTDQEITISATGINTLYQSGKWTGPGTINSPMLNVSEVSNISIGTNKYFWTITDSTNICSSTDSLIVTTVSAPLTGPDLCLSTDSGKAEITLSGNSFVIGTERGFWTNKDSSGVEISLNTDFNLEVPTGIHTFFWNIENTTNASCGYIDSIKVRVISKAVAGENLCLLDTNTSIQLNANTFESANGETGSWKSSPPLTFTDQGSPTSMVIPGNPGIYKLTWILENEGCADSSDVELSLVSIPRTLGNICLASNDTNNIVTLEAENYDSTYQVGSWHTNNGSIQILNDLNRQTFAENLPIGVNKFYWTLSDTLGSCSFTDSLNVSILTKPDVFIEECLNADANNEKEISLPSDNYDPTIETGYWQSVEGVPLSFDLQFNASANLNPGTYGFVWTIVNNETGCQVADTINTSVISNATINESNKFPLCIAGLDAAVTLSADSAWSGSGETGRWSKEPTIQDGTFSDSTNNNTDIVFSNLGVHRIYWTIQNKSCIAKDSMDISILSKPVAGNNQCVPYINGTDTEISLSASPPDTNFETGKWSILNGSGSFFTAIIDHEDSSSTKVTGLLKGVDRYRWTISDISGTCSFSDTISISQITPPNAGPALCKIVPQGDSYINVTLSANNYDSGEIGYWTTLDNIVFQNSYSRNTNTFLGQGKYSVIWNIENLNFNGCKLKDTIDITVISKAIAGPAQCLSTPSVSTVLTGSSYMDSTGEKGTWINQTINSTATFEDSQNPASKVNNLKTGVHRFKWLINNDGCRDSSFTTVALITKPNAGGNKCLPFQGENTPVTLSANAVSAADTSVWIPSNNSITGVSLNPNKNICDVTVFDKGAFTIFYKVRDTAGVCPFLIDSSLVTVLTKPDLAESLCEKVPFGQNIKNIALATKDELSSQETGTWSSASSLTFSDPNAKNTQAFDVSTGKYKIFWSIHNNTDQACQLSDSLTLRVISEAYAGNNICIIKPVENTILNANLPDGSSGEKGLWKLISTPVNQVQFDANNPQTTVIRLPLGVSKFRWYIENETCIDSSDVEISVQSKANAGSDFSICGRNIEVAANPISTLESGMWEILSGNEVTIADSSLSTTNISNLVPGRNTLVWTVMDNICSNSDTLVITNNQPSSVNILTQDQETCFTANTLVGNNPGTEISTSSAHWKLIQEPVNNSPKTIINSPDSDSTLVRNLNSAGDYIFVYQIYNSICDTIADTVTITRNESIYNFATGPLEACQNDTILLEGQPIPSDGEGSWTLSGGAGIFESPKSHITRVYDFGTKQNLFYWKLKRGECENLQGVAVEGYAVPDTAHIFTQNSSICDQDSITIEANDPEIGKGKWTIITGSGNIKNPNQPVTKVSDLGFGQNIFMWSVSNGPCDSSQAYLTIFRSAKETEAEAGADTLLCGNTLVLNAKEPQVGTGRWNLIKGYVEIDDPFNSNTSIYNISYSENKLVWSVENGACFSSDTISITAASPVDQAYVTDTIKVCGENNITISANTPVSGTGQWNALSGNTVAQPFASTTSVLTVPVDTSLYEWVIQKGFCKTSDTLVLINFQLPRKADAGPDVDIYSDQASLTAVPADHGWGQWTSLTPSVYFYDSTAYNTSAYNILKGTTALVWTVGNGVCPTSSDTVYIFRNDFKIPNAFSPNGDLFNNTFEIKGLELFSPASLKIINRWGDEVYFSENYTNNWDGRNNSGKELVDDTYFYILKLNDGQSYQGYVILKR